MKKILGIALFITLFAFTANAQFKFGAQGQLWFDGSFFGVGAKGHNTFNEDFAGQGSFTYFFESGVTVWALDLDVHYSGFEIGDLESFRLTPFAGLNIFNVDVGFGSASNTGLNLGMNGTMPLGDSLEFFVEPKITIGGGSSFSIAGGVYF